MKKPKMEEYEQFVARKLKRPLAAGFEPVRPLNEKLFAWQKVIVEWAIRKGRCALFESCGLGKTIQQLEWALHVSEWGKRTHQNGRVLILAPLAVAQQTVEEGARFGYDVRHIHEPDEVIDGIIITNYERAERFDLSQFVGVVLDESSVLKNITGKTRQFLTTAFSQTPFKLCCTATPAPNDYMEFGQHSEFLGVLGSGEMLATWFVNDTADTGTWRLKGHARKDFWRWVSSWAACVSTPSDIGFPDDGYILPPLNIEVLNVEVDNRASDGEELFRMPQLSATNLHKELRMTSAERVKALAALVNDSKDSWVVWCYSNIDSERLANAIPDAVEVKGSDSEQIKEERLNAFSHGKARVIITKPSIAGHGLNWQHCAHHVYCGLTYSFEEFYQSMRRGYRFGQTKPFNVWIVLADTMGETISTVRRKIAQHEEMQSEMRFAAEYLKTTTKEQYTMREEIEKKETKNWTLYHGDAVPVAKTLAKESVDFSVFSPPFANLFVYSADAQDMGNCADEQEFAKQYRYLVTEQFRIMKPGRLCAVHCVDLLATKWKDGDIELKNFSGILVDLYREAGWLFHCRVTIWKDPVTEMQRTKALGLLHKQLLKDSSMSRVGNPEYLLVFRKPGKSAVPISHEREDYPVELWQKDASPVWMDVRQERTLNGKAARESQDERHICPLQLDVIERALRLWSNPGDLVYSPFAGIGSEGYCALAMRRRFVGSELKKSYFEHACGYLTQAESEAVDLFTMMGRKA